MGSWVPRTSSSFARNASSISTTRAINATFPMPFTTRNLPCVRRETTHQTSKRIRELIYFLVSNSFEEQVFTAKHYTGSVRVDSGLSLPVRRDTTTPLTHTKL